MTDRTNLLDLIDEITSNAEMLGMQQHLCNCCMKSQVTNCDL
ncbi:hypothetical protein I305_04480 [Cryptococcus gattii E566]|uniref:Uncharacterized protein n=2 Tax=Cryptococcus gattii TaxID=37769 RepID=E6R797_CRYGW|nr:Hypothetical Protein CGB_E4545C [Cryptococcus gattii WM276]ADV22581.1 Hypothetical Protein CGB_E4545C [Cryptococcus gattii WM276]KIR78322.1 hypothetical protein I306_04597 [Cryptococcus gattii EJB2]KIY33151.1 hypothetical protein I305_04480 [Cryptococcus gattii E566]KJE02836.1 hypothetical protein I311_03337 [Cryptococcus gattii NT-10]